jgi:hypothetical protein
MSKLELFIKKCREVWESIAVEPKMMDDMIDEFAKINIKLDYDLDKITEEDIKLSTRSYINDIMIRVNKEKDNGNRI